MLPGDVPSADDAAPSIAIGYCEGVTVVNLVGEHDMTTADDVRSTIANEAELGRGVVVSLTETDFIDSSILRALFHCDNEMISTGRRLVLHLSADESIVGVLELTRLTELLLCTESLDEAIEFATQSSP